MESLIFRHVSAPPLTIKRMRGLSPPQDNNEVLGEVAWWVVEDSALTF